MSLLFISLQVSAEYRQWSAIGPFGALVRHMVQDPVNTNRFYVSFSNNDYNRGHISASQDGGNNWFEIPAPPGVVSIRSIVITRTGYLYVLAPVVGRPKLFRTLDEGTNWEEIDVGSLWLSPIEHEIAYPDLFFSSHYSSTVGLTGTYRSTNGGITWDRVNALYPNQIAISPLDSDLIYARDTSRPGGPGQRLVFALHKSTDGGLTFEKIDSPMDFPVDPEPYFFPWRITLDPDDPNRIYLTSRNSLDGSAYFYVSNNGGQDWNESLIVAGASELQSRGGFNRLLVLPGTSTRMISLSGSRIFLSDDDGLTWDGGRYIGSVSTAVLDRNDPNVVHLGMNSHGHLVSHDAGASFLEANAGINERSVFQLAAGRSGVHLATTSGQLMFIPNLADMQPRLEVDFNRRGFRSYGEGISAIAVNPNNEQVFAATIRRLFRGPQWDSADLTDPRSFIGNAILAIPSEPETAVVAFRRNPLFFGPQEPDGSGPLATKKCSVASAVCDTLGDFDSATFEYARSQPLRSYSLGAASDFWKSDDGGQNWSQGNAPGESAPVMAVDPFDENRVLIAARGTGSAGFFVTNNAGEDWNMLDGPPGDEMTALAIDPLKASRYFAAVDRSGIWMSDDSGLTWAAFGSTLNGESVSALEFSSDGHALYAATEGSGVFHYAFSVAGGALAVPSLSGFGLVLLVLLMVIATIGFCAYMNRRHAVDRLS